MNNLNDQEKSVLLAKLCGWEVIRRGGENQVVYIVFGGGNYVANFKHERMLYDPANMALLAKVIEFIISKEGGYLMLDKIPEEQIYTSPHSYLLDFFDFEDFHKSMCEFVDRYLESEPHNTKDE